MLPGIDLVPGVRSCDFRGVNSGTADALAPAVFIINDYEVVIAFAFLDLE